MAVLNWAARSKYRDSRAGPSLELVYAYPSSDEVRHSTVMHDPLLQPAIEKEKADNGE